MNERVRCSGATRKCAKANYGIGCYHRKYHPQTTNCKMNSALDTGLSWCSFQSCYHKCREAR